MLVNERAKRKRERKINYELEKFVLDQLLFTTLDKAERVETAVVIANVCYSLALIFQAAAHMQQWTRYNDDLKVQQLKIKRGREDSRVAIM